MFTQNYINLQFNRFFGLINGTSGGMSAQSLIATDGSKKSLYNGSAYYDIGEILQKITYDKTNNSGIAFGSGTTPASLSDYALEKMITSGISGVSVSRNIGREDDGRFCVYGQYALKNTSSASISISEIGAIQAYKTGSSSTSCVLLERTVLDEPVVINPNEIKLITYKLIFNQGMYA